jgi:hypothetical protein
MGTGTTSGVKVEASPDNDDDCTPAAPTPAIAPAGAETATGVAAIGSGDVVRSIVTCGGGGGRASSDSGGRTPPRRKRGATRGLRKSAGGGGGSESSALLGSHERNVRCDRASTCGAGLERELWTAGVPIPVPIPEPASVLGVALSGAGLHGSSGRREGKNRRGGTLVVFGERRDDVVTGAAESSASGSALGPALLPSRPDERRREVKSVKSTVRDRAGRRLMDGWRVSGGADGAAVGDGGAHPSGDVSRRRTQSSRRVAERSI